MIRLPYALAILAYCGVIFWFSSQPHPVDIDVVPGLDKPIHFLIFGGLSVLVSVGLRRSHAVVHPMVQFLFPVGFATAYGLFDELHQFFVPERMFDPLDLLANFFGALLANWVLCKFVWGVPIGRHATPPAPDSKSESA